MFEKRVTLFRLLGFEVRVDPSWLVLALLISWTLAESVFPARYKNLSPPTYWLMGVTGAVGLFASIVFHELCHSLVARAYGVSMKGITLFIFGGVAEMDEEPAHPKAEFFMAVIGPISSLALCAACYGVYRASALFGWPAPAQGVARYLALMNGMLAVFNLLPGFPLDGGRVLRSILWAFKGNLRWATRVASQMGAGLGTALLVLGILNIVVGREFIGGIWWLLIGMFLRNASRASYQQLVARKAFEGEPLRRFMQPDPVTVPPSITIQELVEEYIYRYHYKMFPVVRDGALLGCVSTGEVKRVPRERWHDTAVHEIMRSCSGENTVRPGDDAMRAIGMMTRTGASRLLVVEGERLVGIVSLKDMLKLLSLKLDLEEDE